MARRSSRNRRSSHNKLITWARLKWFFIFAFGFSVLLAIYIAYLDHEIRDQFEGKRWSIPARVYARPLEMYPNMRLSTAQFMQELEIANYHETQFPARPGTYNRKGNNFQLVTRAFKFWDGEEPSVKIQLRFSNNYLETLYNSDTGEVLPLVRLDPGVIGRIYPSHTEDRILVKLEEVPPLLIRALLIVEDRNFYHHRGVSPRSIARAFLANMRAGSTVQGGSTLTQQLVKNFFLSNERTIWRKANEAIMSILLEVHYQKDEILEAYLNEIYLGQDGKRAIHGFGLASQFYFEKPLNKLSVDQISLLVALVKGASYYSPRRYSERALERRNLILDMLAEQGEISKSEAIKAKGHGLGVTKLAQSNITSYPAFMDLVRRQLRRDYKEEDLNSDGLQIFTTLDPSVQIASETAVVNRVEQLAKGKDSEEATLQAATIVVSIDSGEVLAMVGGRNPRFAGFNRALDATRPIGSLVKPAVYLTALSDPNRYTLSTLIDDSPLTLQLETGDEWTPQNFDLETHGMVPLYEALVYSYNISTARLGLDVGLNNIIETLKKLGIERPIKPYPSLLLGATALTPQEVTQMYLTIASGGFRTPLRSIREVLTAKGEPLQRYPLAIQHVLNTAPTYLVKAALYQVTRRGTGRAVYQVLPNELHIAGKTGTSDDLRDSWFVGFTGGKLGVVWIGLDNNQPAGLTGSSGALRVWRDVFRQINIEPSEDVVPSNIEMVRLDANSGLRAPLGCSNSVELPFIIGSAPTEYGPCTEEVISGSGAEERTLPSDSGLNWFRRLFE